MVRVMDRMSNLVNLTSFGVYINLEKGCNDFYKFNSSGCQTYYRCFTKIKFTLQFSRIGFDYFQNNEPLGLNVGAPRKNLTRHVPSKTIWNYS